MFIQYAPYKLRESNWDALRDSFADRCFDLLNEYAPNFKRSVLARQVLTPLDLERTFNLTGGNIFQGAMSLNQLFSCGRWWALRIIARRFAVCTCAARRRIRAAALSGRRARMRR